MCIECEQLISVSKWVEIAAVKITIGMGISDMAANSPNAEEGITVAEIAMELGSDAVIVHWVLTSRQCCW